MRYTLLTIFVAASLTACGRDNLDWKSIAAELEVAIPAGTTRTEAFSRKLEQWMSDLGMSIKIDHPRENGLYLSPFNLASHASDDQIRKILAHMSGATNRADFVKRHLEERRVDTIAFDRADWDAKQHSNTQQRYRLFKGYCAKKSPIGLTRAEIESDLGSSSNAPDAPIISYYVGNDFGFGIDSLHVCLTLENGKITEYDFIGD